MFSIFFYFYVQNLSPNKLIFAKNQMKVNFQDHQLNFRCIENSLTDAQFEKLKDSCLGFLLDINSNLKVCSMIVHSLILHEEGSSSRQDIRMNFGGKRAKFGIEEFALITGLNCSQLPTDVDHSVQPNRLMEKYFSGKSSISRNDLKNLLMSSKIDDEDAVKIAKVHIVQNILESKRGDRFVDDFVLKLVDDEQKFENYPWGRRSFNETIGSISSVLDLQKNNYELCGFPVAFQVWGYEVIPSLGSLFGARVSSKIPRILNWKSTKVNNLRSIWSKVFQKSKVRIHIYIYIFSIVLQLISIVVLLTILFCSLIFLFLCI